MIVTGKEQIWYGAASTIQKDLTAYLKRTVPNLESLHMWRTKYCEIVVALLDYPELGKPMVDTIVRVFQRFVEEGTNHYYWKEIESHAHYEGNNANLMIKKHYFCEIDTSHPMMDNINNAIHHVVEEATRKGLDPKAPLGTYLKVVGRE